MKKKELRQFLLAHSREALADWVLGVAKDSPDFRQRLEFYAGTHASPEAALAAVRQAIAEFAALVGASRKLLPAEIAKTAVFLMESIRACIDYGFRDEILELIEHAMVALDQMVARQAKLNARLNLLQREYATLHVSTAELVKPDPEVFAQRLFRLRENAEAQILVDLPITYLGVLGKPGLAKLRELLDPTYRIVAKISPQLARSRRDLTRFANRRTLLYEWAVVSEDVDEQVTILMELARLPEQVLTLAGYLDSRGRPMDAVQAVKKAFERAPGPTLAQYLAERLEAQQQPGEALEYRWFLFEKTATRETYDGLLGVALRVGTGQAWRDRAMAFAEENAKGLFVEMLLLEGKSDEALTAAHEGGASLATWAVLADRHSATEPQVAIGLYFDCVNYGLNEGWKTPEDFVSRAWELASDTATFQTFNARLRLLFGRERLPKNLAAVLEGAGIPVAKLLQ